MNKIKSLYIGVYSPTILDLYHSFIYSLNEFEELNRRRFIAAIFLILFHLTKTFTKMMHADWLIRD